MKNPILDFRHWIGWGLTVGIIILMFHLLGVHGLHKPLWHVIVLLVTVVFVDTVKHYIGLQ